MDDSVWTAVTDDVSVRRGLGRGLAAILPARAANATGLLPHLAIRRRTMPEGLLSRSALTQRLDEVLSEGRRQGTSAAVVVFGLDGFRHVTDRVGHEAADGLLRRLGERLARARRAGDAVAHLDGDVFAVVCPRVGSAHAGVEVIRRLSAELAGPIEGTGIEDGLRASFGLALATAEVETPGRVLLRRAEMAMLRAKDEGVAWVVYEPGPAAVTSDPGGRPPGSAAGADEPRQWEDRRLRLGP